MIVRIPPFIAVAFLLLVSCSPQEKSEILARKYCSTCHLFPDPSMLDKKTWEKDVLPEMSFRMGLDLSKLPGTNAQELNEILLSLPAAPLVSEEDWQSIQAYYRDAAPDSLLAPAPEPALPLTQFTVSGVKLPISNNHLLTMVKANPADGKILIATRPGKLFQFDRSLTVEDSFQLPSPASDILFGKDDTMMISCMGMMDPNDLYAGSLVKLSGKQEPTVLIDSIKRPVDIEEADLNKDSQSDLIISGFGNFTGSLRAFEKADDKYLSYYVHNFPGNRKTIVNDLNRDGLPDILALIAQGDEQIALFTNRGNFKFSYQVLLKFPPVYGSSYFELVDFNADGYLDILYTNGDNADYSAILKPYHGVRIFLNDGKNQFKESWFYPMHGASMARASDFDADGDIDLAAISFFPDFKRSPENGFLYFENRNGKLTAFQTPLAVSARWITMETTDIDEDGDTDLLLGALAFPTSVPESLFKSWGEKKMSLLVLKNNSR